MSPSPQQLVVDATPVGVEKPYLTIDAAGKYSLVTPRPSAGSSGTQFSAESERDGFERVFVASNATDVGVINAKLERGLHVVLGPGIYHLPSPIRIGFRAESSPDGHQVLLGLGLATLVPTARPEQNLRLGLCGARL